MQQENKDTSLEALQEIRSIMDRSARFISLSGWSGIWAGCTALAGAYIAHGWLHQQGALSIDGPSVNAYSYSDPFIIRILLLAICVFATALVGGYYFTYRKAREQQQKLWNNASRQMGLQLFLPMLAGGVFCMAFIYYGVGMFIAPACLAFYGLGLIGASRFTLSDIRYLGMLNLLLGCISLFFPGYGLYFWAAGFGVLHILYGVFMWNKYDK
ncbi:MAG: hypothetical protein JWQ38_3038 [Flavipsychrobacter sp.]|nr:hypothetical protein [Flavipsychrobacter sp.]